MREKISAYALIKCHTKDTCFICIWLQTKNLHNFHTIVIILKINLFDLI